MIYLESFTCGSIWKVYVSATLVQTLHLHFLHCFELARMLSNWIHVVKQAVYCWRIVQNTDWCFKLISHNCLQISRFFWVLVITVGKTVFKLYAKTSYVANYFNLLFLRLRDENIILHIVKETPFKDLFW